MPLVGFSKSAITRNKVVFPQPLGPISDTKSPELTFILIPESACTGSDCVSNVRHRLLISIISCFYIAGCSKDEVTDLRSSADIIYVKASNSMGNGNYRNATNYLEVLTTSFPFSNQAKQAQLDLIFAHYRSSSFEEAIDEAKQFEKENPTHPRVDYALYMR